MTTLSTMQVAKLPTHDPLVGRIVGSVFVGQAWENKPEKALLEGSIDGRDRISLTYERQADGSVTADGRVGDLDVHERFESAEMGSPFPTAMLFGVGQTAEVQRAAASSGTIGGNADKLAFAIERETNDVQLTDELRNRSDKQFTMGQKIGIGPTFGGESVPTYLVPAQYRAETPAICTSDEIGARGKIGDVQLSRGLKWNMTTWSVAWNNREGWAWNELHAVEDATESQYFVGKDEEKTYTPQPFRFSVKDGVVETRGSLRTERPGEAAVEMPVSRKYTSIREKNAVKVEEQFGDQRMEFTIYPAQ